MSRQTCRLPDAGRVDRSAPLVFQFDGKTFEGYRGDSLASALLANGVHLVGRSFKYHRPRGIMGAGSEEPNALVRVGTGNASDPNQRATRIELRDGLVAGSQNCWPSLGLDIGAVNNLLYRFLPAGFYYKTFMWPASRWMTYEHWIRRAAGLGRAPEGRDPDRYEKVHAHVDILVIGAGPAGLAAALAGAAGGARVILADEQSEFGGSLLADLDCRIDGRTGTDWVSSTLAALSAMPEVTLLPRTVATGYYDHNYLTMHEELPEHAAGSVRLPRQRLWKVRARHVVLATGAIERPLVFANNDRPGIMLSSAVRSYVERFGVTPGHEVLLFTNNDDAYRTALALHRHGVRIAGLVDLRAAADGPLADAVRGTGVHVMAGHAVVTTRGRHRVRAAEIMKLGTDGMTVTGKSRSISCDAIAVSGGWTPTVNLHSQGAGRLRWDESIAGFVPDSTLQAATSAGACNGATTLAALPGTGMAGRARRCRGNRIPG